jgi:aminotransferase
MLHPVAQKTLQFTESVIREMTRLAVRHKAINLAQGFPDFPAPEPLKEAARDAIARDINQYAITWGAPVLRQAIAEKFQRDYGVAIDPEKQICVTCGSTEAMIASMLAVVNPGDEVVVFEPFYENYGPDAVLAGARPRFVRLREPDWTFDRGELAAAFTTRTRAVIVNTPHNPTGKVFTYEELKLIADLCQKYNAIAVTDEIYEHILYEQAVHVPMATIDGMQDRTVTINALSKTYSVTGWRVGWAIADEKIIDGIRKVHDFLTVGAAAPLQEAGATALRLPPQYYLDLQRDYRERRDVLLRALEAVGFRCFKPAGAYYIMTDIAGFGFPDDAAFALHLVQEVGVAAVPGSSFYHRPQDGHTKLRFAFPKRLETLHAAARRLSTRLKPRSAA